MVHNVMLEAGNRTGPTDGRGFPTAGRTRWSLTVNVGRLEDGAAVGLALEGSMTGAESTWRTLYTFPDISAVGTTVVRSFRTTQDGAFEVTDADKYLRVRVLTATGDYALEVKAEARFLDPAVPEEKALLSQELRSWDDGLERTVAEAEEVVLDLLRVHGDPEGNLWALWEDPFFTDSLRRNIATQAEHLYGRYRLARTGKSGDLEVALKLSRAHPGVADWAMSFRAGRQVWRGR